jgi:nicotinamidase-related amidase
MNAKHLMLAVFACAALASPAWAGTIIDEWASIKTPPPPKLEAVTVDPKTTALLLLDLTNVICNEKRPRCLASLPQVAKLLKAAREAKTTVIYSTTPGSTAANIQPQVKPEGGEPTVTSHGDKFIETGLEKILKDKGVKTVIVVGTVANGAVLYTASHAAFLGFNVVIPVDGVSADTPYAEQYVAWNMAHAPLMPGKIELTAIDMVKF